MTYEEIKQKVVDKEINFDQALQELCEIGYCPNLLNDDNGHWAVTFSGFQDVPMGKDPEDIATSFFIMAEDWKDSIYEAFVWGLSK